VCFSELEGGMMGPECGHKYCHECIVTYLEKWCEAEGLCSNGDDLEGKCPHFSCQVRLRLSTLTSVARSDWVTQTTPLREMARGVERKHEELFGGSTAEDAENDSRIEGTDDAFLQSTKIAALMEALREAQGELGGPTVKSLVFSQFTMCLDLVAISLARAGFNYVRLDGTMHKKARLRAVSKFKTDVNTSVFLISLKTGCYGLNLTEATRVYLLDPWWNPSTEQQAIDRACRLGQRYPVIVTRFIIHDSIEERILQLQETKRRITQGALSGGQLEHQHTSGTLGVHDLHLLFRNAVS